MNIETLATQLNVTEADLLALIEGGQVEIEEIYADTETLELTAEGVEILTEAVKALA